MSAALYQSVLRAFLQKSVWTGVKHALADDVFLDTNTRLLLAQIDRCHGSTPDRDVSLHDLRTSLEVVHKGDLLGDLLVYVEAMGGVDPAPQYVVRQLLARELLDQAAQSIIESRNSGAVEIDGPAALISRAKEVVNQETGIPTISLGDSVLPAVGAERGRVISLGVSKRLDKAFDGGIGLGEVIIYIARTNGGKTTYMCATAADAVQAGNSVLYIILGDSGPGKILRLIERRALKAAKIGWTEAQSVEARSVLTANGGRLSIKDMRGIDATLDIIESTINAHARATGAPVDLVVLDYLELVAYSKGERKGQEVRHHYGYIGRQAKRMTTACSTRLLTAWQTNREGSKVDTAELTHLSESWDIAKHVDGAVSINRGVAEKFNKRARLAVLKQREDDAGEQEILIYCDYTHMRMEDLDAATEAA